MSEFLEDLAAQRRKFLDGLDANQGDINLDIFEDFYPDQAHFVFELLQNAEDAGANEVRFALEDRGCLFEHNGSRKFSENDVRAITGIHNSTKAKTAEQIGKFGLGFKSVFVYTASPEVMSGEFFFRITRQVMPEPILRSKDLGQWTRFWLPFNHPKMTPEHAYEQIQTGLTNLSATTLLFLRNIKSIAWRIEDGADGGIAGFAHSQHHMEVLKRIGGKLDSNSHFFKFDRLADGLEKQHIAIAFALELLPDCEKFESTQSISEQFKIVPIKPGQVFVSFPAEKESSGLRFHVHAPFVPELSRASVKDTLANQPLFDQLELLVADSLFAIRDSGLLTTEFLGVLPNPEDNIPSRYAGIRETIIERMKEQPLTPSHIGPHTPAKHLLQARAPLKSLLSESDLQYLFKVKGHPPRWAVGATQRNSNVDRFIYALDITEWDVNEFATLIVDRVGPESTPAQTKDFIKWLGQKAPDWHQSLYAILYGEHVLTSLGGGRGVRLHDSASFLDCFEGVSIVRLSDGHYGSGKEVFFSDDNSKHNSLMRRADPAIYSSGKNEKQKENAKQFLIDIGVRTVGDEEVVEIILRTRYAVTGEPPDIETYISDLNRFMNLTEENPECAGKFKDFRIFMRADSKWSTPGQVYLDNPFTDTGLSAYYDALGYSTKLAALSEEYYSRLNVPLDKIGQFASLVGAKTLLDIKRVSCRKNRLARELVDKAPGNATAYKHDEDYTIDNIERVIDSQSTSLSRLIWRTLISDATYWSRDWSKAKYSANASQSLRTAPSQLAAVLSEAEWIPQNGGRFVTPTDASARLLPEGFQFDNGWQWLSSIHFGKRDANVDIQLARDSGLHKKMLEAAMAAGFKDEETFERVTRFARLSVEKQEEILAEFELRSEKEFPNRQLSNPGIRSARVSEQAEYAPERETEMRLRSVSIDRDIVKKEADPYLVAMYTNSFNELICQICQKRMPFKLSNGEYYFEAAEFLPDLQKRHFQNYLALCPNHSAMFRYANDERELLCVRFLKLQGSQMRISLGGAKYSVYFNSAHKTDLIAVLSAESSIDQRRTNSYSSRKKSPH